MCRTQLGPVPNVARLRNWLALSVCSQLPKSDTGLEPARNSVGEQSTQDWITQALMVDKIKMGKSTF